MENWIVEGVMKTAGPDLKPYIGPTFKLFEKANPKYQPVGGPFDRWLGETIRAIATDLMTMPEIKGQKRAARPLFEYAVDNLERSRLAVERIGPEVEKIRVEVFGHPRPPFKDIAAAEAWVRSEGERDRKTFSRANCRIQERRAKLEAKVRRLFKELDDLSIGPWATSVALSPLAVGAGILTAPGTKLRLLRDRVAELLRLTAPFTEAGLTAHVLTGVLPIAKLIEIKVHGPVYHRDMMSFLKRHPELFAKKRKINDRDLSLYNFVQALGVPPKKKGAMKFWEHATSSWNKHNPGRPFTFSATGSRDGMMKAFERAMAKMEGSRKDDDWHVRGVAAFSGIDQRAIGKALADGKRLGQEIMVVYFAEAPKSWENNYATFIADRLYLDAAIDRFVRSGGKPFED